MNQKRVMKVMKCSLICLLLSIQMFSVFGTSTSSPKIENLKYFDEFDNAWDFTDEELELLEQNEFIVLNRKGTDDIIHAFEYYWIADLPVMITTDLILQVWHLIFDKCLKEIEAHGMYPLLCNYSSSAAETYLSVINPSQMSIAERDIALYLVVAAKLAMNPMPVPSYLEDDVTILLQAIYDEITFQEANITLNSDNLSRFKYDYTQFKPRGHYTESLTLEAYFRLFKWLVHCPFIFDHYIAEEYNLRRSPEEMVESAIILSWAIKNAEINWDGQIISGREICDIINNFLKLVIGTSYSINLKDIDFACAQLSGTHEWDYTDFTAQDRLGIQNMILNNESIPDPYFEAVADSFVDHQFVPLDYMTPKTFYFLGERVTLDSYTLDRLVYPYIPVPEKKPNGLEVAASCISSDRAFDLLNSYYSDQFITIREDIENWDEDEKETVVWEWTESLRELTKPLPQLNEEYSQNIPEFMKPGPWYDEKLTTVLGSWAQLRHDTILYVQQSYTPEYICSTPEGYVEPYPNFYSSMQDLSTMYQESITQLMHYGSFNTTEFDFDIAAFTKFNEILTMLEEIAISELTQQGLTYIQKKFIQHTYATNFGCNPVPEKGWLHSLLCLINHNDIPYSNEYITTRASLIADVHTDARSFPDPPSVLECATGLLEHLICIVPGFDGEEILAVGPVFSYYEFWVPIDHRMTDEEWRGIIYDFGTTQCFRGPWAQTYMVSLNKTESPLPITPFLSTYYSPETFIPPAWYYLEQTTEFIPSYRLLCLDVYRGIPNPIIPSYSWTAPLIMGVIIFVYIFAVVMKYKEKRIFPGRRDN